MSPILKWPGGKTRVLPEIRKYYPPTYNTYYEPFLGGASVFFDLNPTKATISDVNPELINLYHQIKENLDDLISELKKPQYVNDKETYLTIRSWDRDTQSYQELSPTVKAARTLYLNRTCFNGLYRVNKANQFNTPYGYYKNPKILDVLLLKEAHQRFRNPNILIRETSYETIFGTISGNKNFVYLDPPYVPLTKTASFASYTKQGFGTQDQEKLAEQVQKLDDEGNYVLVSNSDTPVTRSLYKKFTLVPIYVTRSISANKESRVKAPELLILGDNLANLVMV